MKKEDACTVEEIRASPDVAPLPHIQEGIYFILTPKEQAALLHPRVKEMDNFYKKPTLRKKYALVSPANKEGWKDQKTLEECIRDGRLIGDQMKKDTQDFAKFAEGVFLNRMKNHPRTSHSKELHTTKKLIERLDKHLLAPLN